MIATAGSRARGMPVYGIGRRQQRLEPGLVAFLESRVEEEQRLGVLVLGPALDAPRRRDVLEAGRPVGADRGVDSLLLHRGHELPGLVDRLLIDVGQLGVLVLGFDLAVEPHHVHPALGQEAGVMGQVVGRPVALGIGGDAPEPDGRAVAQDERFSIPAQRHEPALAGDLLVEGTEVEHGVGLEGVALGEERPGSGLARGRARLRRAGTRACLRAGTARSSIRRRRSRRGDGWRCSSGTRSCGGPVDSEISPTFFQARNRRSGLSSAATFTVSTASALMSIGVHSPRPIMYDSVDPTGFARIQKAYCAGGWNRASCIPRCRPCRPTSSRSSRRRRADLSSPGRTTRDARLTEDRTGFSPSTQMVWACKSRPGEVAAHNQSSPHEREETDG